MIEDDFFSDDSDSVESTGSFHDHEDYDIKDFNSIYENKQVETLKFLRMTLKENKIIKRRLHIVENELESYQDFKSLLPVPIEPDRPTDSISSGSSNKINDDFLVTTDDKECQVDLLVPPPARSPTPESVTPVSIHNSELVKSVESLTQVTEMTETVNEMKDLELEVYQMPEVVKFDKACQCDPPAPPPVQEVQVVDLERDKSDSKLNEEMKALKQETQILHEERDNLKEEIQVNNVKIRELKVNNKNLMEKYDSMMSSHELTNGLLDEAKNQILLLKKSNDELEDIKPRYNILQTENEELTKENVSIQIRLKNKTDEIAKLNESIVVLTANFSIIESQREKIEYLESECEKHLNEKHIVCEKRINELTEECQNNANFIDAQKNELLTLQSSVVDLNQQMEKNKIELQSFNFKEFISLKRELGQLREEKEKQFASQMSKKQQVHREVMPVTLPGQPLPLPPIKDLKNEKKTTFKFFH